MSTEEKTTSNPEVAEPRKPKRRFKLDKKYLQGFAAGILVATIAFTGLYYGTDGQFFKGLFSGGLPVVTDVNFESEVLQSDQIVLAVVYIDSDPVHTNQKDEDTNKKNIEDARKMASFSLFNDKIKAVYLDVNNSSETIQAYNIQEGPRILVFQDGKCVFEGNKDRVFQWAFLNCR